MYFPIDLTQWSIKSILQKKAPQWNLALGSDVFIFYERLVLLHEFCRKNTHFSFVFQNEAEFFTDTTWLWERDLFEDTTDTNYKIIILSQVTEKMIENYINIISLLPQNCFIFLLGKDIKYSGAFVTQLNIALKKKHQSEILRIRCYTAPQKNYIKMLQEDVQQFYNVNMSHEAAEWFIDRYLEHEGWAALLKTMMLHQMMQSDQKNEFSIENAQKFFTQQASDFIQDINSFYFKKINEWILCIMQAKNDEAIPICRILNKHMMMLLEARIRVDNGLSIHESVQQITPPLYFQRFDEAKTQIGLWSQEQIKFCIDTFFCIEIMVKRNDYIWWRQVLIELLRKNI